MFVELIVAYFVGWIVAALGLYAAGKRMSDERAPSLHPLPLSVAAGAVWPLLVVGLVELSSVVVFTKVQSKPGPGVGIFA